MAFRWRVDDGPLLVVIGLSLPHSPKRKKNVRVAVGPTLTKLSGFAHVLIDIIRSASLDFCRLLFACIFS